MVSLGVAYGLFAVGLGTTCEGFQADVFACAICLQFV